MKCSHHSSDKVFLSAVHQPLLHLDRVIFFPVGYTTPCTVDTLLACLFNGSSGTMPSLDALLDAKTIHC